MADLSCFLTNKIIFYDYNKYMSGVRVNNIISFCLFRVTAEHAENSTNSKSLRIFEQVQRNCANLIISSRIFIFL